ncbi:hypothetical protein P4112_17065 [Pseudomonas aeruginosa]|nr:hypothetical protein [Pseudomonas aeruginosa]
MHAAGEARPALCRELAGQMNTWMADLHRCHHTEHQGRRISFGLLRLANIEPLIELAQAILAQGAPEGLNVHLCVYHSRHPLLVRSAIERQLDELLKRSDDDAAALFARPTLAKALQASTERDHLFVVLASPVAEVGRDHDYDWAIVEPSSMRSIIQLAGRIRRHRSGFSGEANLYLLSRNIRSLEGQNPAFQRPGFETPTSLLTATTCTTCSTPPYSPASTPAHESSNRSHCSHAAGWSTWNTDACAP